jgi:hypothetical protein
MSFDRYLLGEKGAATMITMNGNDRHLASGDARRKGTVVPEFPGGLPLAAAWDRSQAGLDGRAPLLLPWVATAMAFGLPTFVNRMVRWWVSRRAFGAERFSAPGE